MKRFVVTSFGLLLAIVLASPNYGQTVYQFDGGGIPNDDFLVAANWNDILAGPDAVPGPMDEAVINAGFVVKYDTAVTTTVAALNVGADWPPPTGPFGTPGTLNMSTGKLVVAGPGDAFEIGRACCLGDGIVNLTGDAVLEIQGSDPIVGTRDRAELNIGPNASVISTRPDGAYWRVGHNGPSIDPFNPIGGLQGEGLLNVEGSFSAHVIFVGVDDGDGVVRVSGNGSLTLTDNLVPGVNTHFPNRSALIQMIGSNATLSALNLESANGLAQVHNQYEFTADSGGVSPITLSNAVNITNNDLVVNLNGLAWNIGDTLLLFDAAPGQIYGEFASSIVNGSIVPHRVDYDNVTGDIRVALGVPEPSTMLLLGLGMVMAISAKRRESR
jgi:hypothetical protein